MDSRGDLDKRSKKSAMDDEAWKDMDDKFIPEIKKIEKLTDRNLSNWFYYRS